MAKKSAKAKSSAGKTKQNVPKQLKSKSKQNNAMNWPVLFLVPTVVGIIAIVFSFYQSHDDYHKPTVGYIDIQNHEEVPVQVELLADHPKVYMLHNVLSDSECEEIINQARESPLRTSSQAGTSGNNTKTDNTREWRRSTTAWLRKDEGHASNVVKKLVSRVAAAANVSTASLQRGNPLHVTEYEPDGFYMPHTDSKHLEDLPETATRKEYKGLDGFVVEGGYPYSVRYFTGLCYLSDDFEGGQTIFPEYDDNKEDQPTKRRVIAMQNANSEQTVGNWERLLPALCDGTAEDGMSIPPKRGSCVLFYNHFIGEDGLVGQLDRRTIHAGCTVRGGRKWIANVWAEAIPSDAIREEAKKMAANEL